MASPNGHDEFNHQVAIKLSRALNTLNPNDLLAQRVIDIAKTNSVAGFISGTIFPFLSIPKAKKAVCSGEHLWQVSRFIPS